jgi:arylsulfatase A-like enzyme
VLCLLAVGLTAAYAQPSARTARIRPAATAPALDGPNILVLFTSEQAAGMTGFEGNSEIQTPNLDRLAAESVYFSRCYTPTPQSAPAQATVITGQYPHAHGVLADGEPLKPGTDTFTARLQKGGYACGLVGRWDLSKDQAAEPGFGLVDYVATSDGKWTGARTRVNGKEGETDKYLTDWEADQAIDFIQKFKERPFFLWVCFNAPREPLEYPPDSAGQYPPESLKLPETLRANPTTRPAKLNQSPLATRSKARTADEKALRQDRSKYYAMISRIDQNVGRILEQVDALGLREKTVVVFTSSHGYALGEHGLVGAGPAFYEELVRVPLLVRYPGLATPGARIDRIVGLVDLAPTFLELTGQRRSFIIQGDSLMALLRDPDSRRHGDEEFFEYSRQTGDKERNQPDFPCPVRGMVTKNYKFVDYTDGSFCLYDLKRDPLEMNNLSRRHTAGGPIMTLDPAQAVEPHYISIFRVLRERLDQWRKQTRDTTLR